MTNLLRFFAILVLVLACATASAAQNSNTSTTPAELSIIIGERQIKFTPLKSYQELKLEVFNSTGELIYVSGAITEAELNWNLHDSNGQPLTPGLYAYTLSLKVPDAEAPRRHQGHLILEQGSERLWLTTKDADGVGSEVTGGQLTVARSPERTTAGAGYLASGRTLGERAGTQRDTQGRTIADSKNGVTREAGQPTLNISGSGTTNQLTRWQDGPNGVVADSIIHQTASGDLGVGTTAPGGVFDLQRNSASDILQRFWNTGTGGSKLRYVAANTATAQVQFTGLTRWWSAMVATKDSLQFRTLASNDPVNTEAQLAASPRMTILQNGDVGIGTTAPFARLEVTSTTDAIRAYSTSTAASAWGVFGSVASTTGLGVFGSAGATTGANFGVYGLSHSTSGTGVYGRVSATSGTVYGVYGENAALNGSGVYGRSTATNGTGVIGIAHTGTNAWGVYGSSNEGKGVYGLTVTGYGVYGQATAGSGTIYGVYGENNATGGGGVYGTSSASNGTGVYGVADNGPAAWGVYGKSNYGKGVRGDSPNGTGVYGESAGGSSFETQTYGVVGRISNSGSYGAAIRGEVADPVSAKQLAGSFNGVVSINWLALDNVTAGGSSAALCFYPFDPTFFPNYSKVALCSSSLRYKKNVLPLNSGLNLIQRLRPVSFDWKAGNKPDLGLIAEEVAKVEPRLVTHNNEGEIQGVRYDHLTAVLVKAIKEQQVMIQRQQQRLAALEKLVKRQRRAQR